MTRSVEEPRRASTGLARGVGLLLAGDRLGALAELGQARLEADAAPWEPIPDDGLPRFPASRPGGFTAPG